MPAKYVSTMVDTKEEHGDGVIIRWTMTRVTGKILCATISKRQPYVSNRYVERTERIIHKNRQAV
jgi:hypothetical protein